jgi:chromosome segregation ATPase
MEVPWEARYISHMDDETGTALNALETRMDAGLASLGARMDSGFAKMERHFELQQAQFVDFQTEVRSEFARVHAQLEVLTARVDRLEARLERVEARLERVEARLDRVEERLTSVEQQVRALRDWITTELIDIRRELGRVAPATEAHAAMRRDVDELRRRVDHVESRLREMT